MFKLVFWFKVLWFKDLNVSLTLDNSLSCETEAIIFVYVWNNIIYNVINYAKFKYKLYIEELSFLKQRYKDKIIIKSLYKIIY